MSDALAREVVIALRDVHKAFDGHAVLRGVNLEVHRGEVLTLLGPSGSGKSVLLKTLIGLVPIDRGEIVVDGEVVSAMDAAQVLALRQRVGMVFQSSALFDARTVGENVAYGLEARGRDAPPAEEIAARVAWALRLVGLAGTEDLTPAQLSGGMVRRVGIARTIALRPSVILYDDPTAGLDPINTTRVARVIARLRSALGVTTVVVTHDLRTAFAISDRLAFLNEGRIIADASVAAMRDSRDPVVHDFLAGRLAGLPEPAPFEPEDDEGQGD
jgi:phospholipid/cholesterol/gamma-HCH transport system ATP-binding protein